MPAGATYGAFLYGTELYGAIGIPVVDSVLAIGRRTVEITFDVAVYVRAVDEVITPPVDRYTPIVWGGVAAHAANPDNFVFSRPAVGSLTNPEEAIDVVATYAEGNPDYEVVSGGFVFSTKVWVHTDFQLTARADYEVTVSNVVGTGIPIVPVTEPFVGYVVSQVDRASLHLFDILPAIAQRLDVEGTGDLALFCACLQESFDRIIEDTDAFFNELCSLDYIRREFVDALLYDLGDQFSEIFTLTLNEKRRLAASLVKMYKLKGTCPGIVQVIDFFLGITIVGCRSGWDDCWRLAKGAYPAPVYPHPGETYPLYKGAYPAPTGGAAILGPSGASIWSFWLLHAAPGTLTADQLAKIEAIVNIWKPAYAHYLGVTTP